MLVSEMIEWLKTMPYGATVEVVRHTRGSTYYDQGGNASTVEFTNEEDYRSSDHLYVYGKTFELYTDPSGKQTLTLGKLNE